MGTSVGEAVKVVGAGVIVWLAGRGLIGAYTERADSRVYVPAAEVSAKDPCVVRHNRPSEPVLASVVYDFNRNSAYAVALDPAVPVSPVMSFDSLSPLLRRDVEMLRKALPARCGK